MPVGVEAVGPPDCPHADGGGDGVADGDAGEVGVLDDPAEDDPAPAQVEADGVHVGVVALPRGGVPRAVR